MDIDTFIGQGVKISGSGLTGIDVTTDSDTTAKAYLLSIAGGAAAAGLSVAITIVDPSVYTYIGVTPGSGPESGSQVSIRPGRGRSRRDQRAERGRHG